MVYSVTCQDPITMQNVTCPSEDEPTIDIDSSSTPRRRFRRPTPTSWKPILSAPINWTSIFTSYSNDYWTAPYLEKARASPIS